MTKLIARFTLHFVQSESKIYILDFGFNTKVEMIFFVIFCGTLFADFKAAWGFKMNLKGNLESSENGCKMFGAPIASESSFDFSAHGLSVLVSAKEISGIFRLKMIAVRCHFFKTILDNTNTTIRGKGSLSSILNGLFEHSERLKSTDWIVGKIFPYLRCLLIWAREVREGIMRLDRLSGRLIWLWKVLFHVYSFWMDILANILF